MTDSTSLSGSAPASTALCPGSFDPIHNGHVDIISRAADLVSMVYVVVATNSSKNHMFSADQRVKMIQETFVDFKNVEVVKLESGLLADLAQKYENSIIIKGLRNSNDFEYEIPMAAAHMDLADLETVLLASQPKYTAISSTIIREIAQLGGDVSGYVPPAVVDNMSM